jgi:hypothetical protein
VPSAAECTAAIINLFDRERDGLQALKGALEAEEAGQQDLERLDALRPEKDDEVTATHYTRWDRQSDRCRERLDRDLLRRRGESVPPTVNVKVHGPD